MNVDPPPLRHYLFVCTKARKKGERLSCAGKGRCGADIKDALKEALHRRGWNKKVRLSACGCLDSCEEGPAVLWAGQQPSGEPLRFYRRVGLDDIEKICADIKLAL